MPKHNPKQDVTAFPSLKVVYISLISLSATAIYCVYIYANISVFIGYLDLPMRDPIGHLSVFTEPLGSVVFATIIYLAFLASTYFAVRGAQKERLVWTALLLAFLGIFLGQTTYYAFIILLLIEFLLSRGDTIDYRPVKEKDNSVLLAYFMLYSVLLTVVGYVDLRQSFDGEGLVIAILITLPVILLLCLLITYLIMRKNRWGYIMAVVLLLMNYGGIIPRFRKSIDYAIITTNDLGEAGLTSAVIVDTLRNALYNFGIRYLFCLPSFMAVFLAVFILKRMREKPVNES
jgi:hypothetical protein